MPTYDTPIPGSSVYGQQYALAKKAYEQAKGELMARRSRIMQEYGYTSTYDPTTGQMTDMQVDPWNPYGTYQNLLQDMAYTDMGLADQAAARNLSGPGLGQQPHSLAQIQAGGQLSGMAREMGDSVLDTSFRLQSADLEYARVLADLKLAATQAAVGAEAFNPGTYETVDWQSFLGSSSSSTGSGAVSGGNAANAKKKAVIYRNGKAQVLWAGKYRNKQQMLAFLKSKGTSVKKFVTKYPEAASVLGIRA